MDRVIEIEVHGQGDRGIHVAALFHIHREGDDSGDFIRRLSGLEGGSLRLDRLVLGLGGPLGRTVEEQ